MKAVLFSVASVCCAAAIAAVGDPGAVSQDSIRKDGFTIRCRVDFTDVKAGETLYEVGPVRLSFRMAGGEKDLAEYDRLHGNYLNFPMPDGKCPVIEATLCPVGGRVGIPLGALGRKDGMHDVTLNFDPPHWTICVDGKQDDDMPRSAEAVVWPVGAKERTLSARVKSASFSAPALPDALPAVPDSRRITRSVQYWTPDDHNAWAGDVAVGFWRGRFHVFYLFDRRHHACSGGAGRHFFAHISSADLVGWDEHPHAVPIEEWWETFGTGTPFVYEGKLHLSYGLHTSRLTKDKSIPIGATFAVSEDGIHFRKSGEIIHPTENPTVYNRADGRLGLIAGYRMGGKIWASDRLGGWKLFDGKIPVFGDCPCLFEWKGSRYLLQGGIKFAYSPTGEPGTFVDWAKKGLTPYEGLAVPMVAPFGDDRRIMSGWLSFTGRKWGGWLVFRELIRYPDGTLGTKWVPEIKPPVPPVTYTAEPGKPFRLVFAAEKEDVPALTFAIDPATRSAVFADDVPDVKFSDAQWADNFRITNIPDFRKPYAVRVIKYRDRKADSTIFDVEFGGERTMICRRGGGYKDAVRRD